MSARRTKQLFSLSLLDLLTSALGAIIFLFIITPKGGKSAAKVQQAMVYFDTTQMKIHGVLPDSLLEKSAGDTLFTVLLAYKDLPKPPEMPEPKTVSVPKPTSPPVAAKEKALNQPPAKPRTTRTRSETRRQPTKKEMPKPAPTPEKKTSPKPPVYRGDAPSVPCKVSFELRWANKDDNIDLFVCKGSSCVYGGKKSDKRIGDWDSGKSRNKWFGNDLRTNQEAVRQFDKIIPGEYKIYAEFKESKQNRSGVNVKGLIYTKSDSGQERGEHFSHKLQRGKGRVLIATVVINSDGSYVLKK